MKVSIKKLAAFSVLALLAAQTPAFAHHMMGGKLPETFLQGLLSGLGHPVIGIDHLAAIVGVGLLAAMTGRGISAVLAFSVALIAGVGVHLAKADIPMSELLVGLSTFVIGALIVLRRAMHAATVAGIFAVVGLLHGYALGESIVGAESSPLVAYLAGLLIVQSLIAVASYAVAARLGSLRSIGLAAIGVLVALAGGVSAALASGALT